MRDRQTARKSTAVRDFGPEYQARMIAAQERYLDGLARVNDLNGINDAIQNGDLGRFNGENVQPRLIHPIIRDQRLMPYQDHRATDGPNGRVYQRLRAQMPRQTARKRSWRPADEDSDESAPPAPQVTSSTGVQSKQVRKRPEDEVSPGGTRRTRISSSQGPTPSSSTQHEEIVISSSESE